MSDERQTIYTEEAELAEEELFALTSPSAAPQSQPRRRSEFEIVTDRITVARLYNEGYSISQIAEMLNLSCKAVSADVKKLREEAIAYLQESSEALAADQINRYGLIMQEAWKAWKMSQKPQRKRREKRVVIDGLTESGRTETTEDEITDPGDSRYLDVILRAMENMNRIMGIGATTVNHVITFEMQAARWIMQGELTLDDIRAEFGDETARLIAETIAQIRDRERDQAGKAETIEGEAIVLADD